MKKNLDKHIDYIPNSIPRKTLSINEKKLTFSTHPPIKKFAFKSKKADLILMKIWKRKEVQNTTSPKVVKSYITTTSHTADSFHKFVKKSYDVTTGPKLINYVGNVQGGS